MGASDSLLDPPLGFAHRGASARAAENTLEAFELALALGAGGLESDAWITADGVVVLDHDGTCVVGAKSRPIRSLERRQLPAQVPSLAELYEVCGRTVPLSLDLKDADAARATLRVAAQARALDQLWLCHWNWRTVASLRGLSRAVKLVDSTRTHHMRTPVERRAERMERLGIDALNLHHSDWTPEQVESLHLRGRLAFAWDTQTESEMQRAIGLGIDALYSDHVERLVATLAKCSEP